MGVLTSTAVLAAVALLCSTLLADETQPQRDQVVLTASVVDGEGKQLGTLSASDFIVLEDGAEQKITSVTRAGDVPITLAILLDSSNSMRGEFSKSQAMAIDCARRLRPGDTASFTGFESRVERLQDFTGDSAQLERAIGRVRQRGSTALLNAIVLTLRDLRALATSVGNTRRRVMVVLSDGDDTSSLTPFSEVLDRARRDDTIIYAVTTSNRPPRTRDEAEFGQLARETGGRRLAPDGSTAPSEVCGRMFDDLAHQYAVQYVSSNRQRDGKWRRVDLRVNVLGAKVFARTGYFASK